VVWENQVRPIADVQATLDIDAVANEAVDLLEELIRVQDDAVTDGAAHAGMQNAARDLMQHERVVAEVHGMARVRAALVSHHPGRALGENIDEFALPFVAPLRADYDHRASRVTEHFECFPEQKKGAPAIRRGVE